MTEFQGKKVVITGAGSGLGAATVAACCRAGAEVMALDVDDAAGAAIAAAQGARFFHCDVSQLSDWQTVAEQIDGDIDHLYLNAGIQSAPPEAAMHEYRFEHLTIERYRRLMGVNVDGVVLGLHAFLPRLATGGSVVITGSLAGLVPYDVDPLYSMTKHAVTGLVRSVAPELKERGIRINALCPGGIDTNIIPHAQKQDFDGFMSPEHVAEEVLKLFSTSETGATWTKVVQSRPIKIMRPPGRKRD